MATLEQQKAQQREQWSSAAPGWAKYGGWLERQLGVLSQRLLDAASVKAGARLLDLACGSGEPALSAARRGARVLATDLSPQMVEATRRRAAREGVELEVRVMDLEEIELPDASFDVVTCAAA